MSSSHLCSLLSNSIWREPNFLVVLINKTVLAYGETSEVFTSENLTMTFGGMPPNLLSGPTTSDGFTE